MSLDTDCIQESSVVHFDKLEMQVRSRKKDCDKCALLPAVLYLNLGPEGMSYQMILPHFYQVRQGRNRSRNYKSPSPSSSSSSSDRF
jgi:hypothetical protein